MIYMVVERDETGRTSDNRVPKEKLAKYIEDMFKTGGIEILAVIRLPQSYEQ